MSDNSWREQLMNARPQATEYGESLRQFPNVVGMEGILDAPVIYPVKGFGGWRLEKVKLMRTGLQTADGRYADRSMVLVHRKPGEKNGQPYTFQRFSQREEPALALITCWPYETHVVRYQAPKMRDLSIYPEQFLPRKGKREQMLMSPQTGEILRIRMEEHGAVTDWLREFLRMHSTGNINPDNVYAATQPFLYERPVDAIHRCGTEANTIYSDGGWGLVISASTVMWMNIGLKKEHGDAFRTIHADAFRPNIMLWGLPPNVEDIVSTIVIGTKETRILFGGMSVRCSVTQVDQTFGTRPDKEPLAWLGRNRSPRPDKPSSVTFGINVAVPFESEGHIIARRDPFRIVEEKR